MHTMHQKLTVKAKTCQGKINFASRLQKRTAVDFCHSHYLVIENSWTVSKCNHNTGEDTRQRRHYLELEYFQQL